MWFEDLSPCDYFPMNVRLIAVGWLDGSKPFTTGAIDRAVFDSLVNMSKDPWQPLCAGGFHDCNVCQFHGESRETSNIFIPSDDSLYVCPAMIIHYINAHRYLPPEPFCRAVLACPAMHSMPYLRALARCGGAEIVKYVAEMKPLADED